MVDLDLRLDDTVAIVTGASRRQGIGAAVGRAFAAQGAAVLLTHWQPYDRTKPYGADDAGPAAVHHTITFLLQIAATFRLSFFANGTSNGPPKVMIKAP